MFIVVCFIVGLSHKVLESFYTALISNTESVGTLQLPGAVESSVIYVSVFVPGLFCSYLNVFHDPIYIKIVLGLP